MLKVGDKLFWNMGYDCKSGVRHFVECTVYKVGYDKEFDYNWFMVCANGVHYDNDYDAETLGDKFFRTKEECYDLFGENLEFRKGL